MARSPRGPGRARLEAAATGVLAVALTVQLARLVWVLAAPLGPVGEVPAPPPANASSADFALLSRFDPFFRGGADLTPSADAQSAYRLYAVRSGPGGSAILAGADGRQASYAVGESVAPGLVLAEIAADHVVLESGGRRSRVAFPLPVGGAAPQPVATDYAPPPPSSPSETAAAAESGPQPGDTLMSVNGRAVKPGSRLADLVAGLPRGEPAVVEFQRDGQVRTATIRIPAL